MLALRIHSMLLLYAFLFAPLIISRIYIIAFTHYFYVMFFYFLTTVKPDKVRLIFLGINIIVINLKEVITMTKLLYTVNEAACILNCSSAKIYKLIKNGKIPYGIYGRIYLLHIDDIKTYARSVVNQRN